MNGRIISRPVDEFGMRKTKFLQMIPILIAGVGCLDIFC